jgi:cytochrome c oxidase subunit 1
VPRRHWDMAFSGAILPHEFPGTAYLMMGIMAVSGIAAVVGGAMYLLITVGSVFFGKRIETPGFKRVPVREGMAPPPPPVAVAPAGHGTIGLGGFVAPGTFVLAMIFLVSFVLYYFVNWKYLSTVWPMN